ncbi:SDR family NAD(P)-dependent oxidoreductase [Actinomadura napierensis]|uniref:SDR family oxidoreductase n=1 Tax=Actinomadura napierensis TaxID=267854 RepID=A0ABN2YYA5_9ACTN
MESMSGKTVLVTGSTGGIGKETARQLARLGAQVVLVGRDAARAEAAAAEIGGGATACTGDLTRLDGLRRLAAEVAARHDRLHVLVNNAGGMSAPRTLTEDGVESTFALNVLAPYALTFLLLPQLRAAGGARVVNLTGGIPGKPLDLGNLQGEKTYLGWTFSQYNHAKTALMALSRRLAERLAGDGVTVNVAYPGHAYTPGNRAMSSAAFPYLYRPLVPLIHFFGPRLMNDMAKAAHSSVQLAASPEFEGVTGIYVNGRLRHVPWPAGARDDEAGEAVQRLCERLCGAGSEGWFEG